MNKLFAKIGTVVAASAAFALLCSIGYFTQIGLTQSFGPEAGSANAAPPLGNKPPIKRRLANQGGPRDPVPERVEGWKDVPLEELTNEARLKNRPGNFEAVGVVIDFMRGLYQVEPEYRHLSFPLQFESQFIESREGFKPLIEPDSTGYNRMRKKNIEIESILVFNLDDSLSTKDVPQDMGFGDAEGDRIARLREHYEGRFVLVATKCRSEALDSDSSRTGESIRFVLHRKAGEDWKIIYIKD